MVVNLLEPPLAYRLADKAFVFFCMLYSLYSRYANLPVGGVRSVHLWWGSSLLGVGGCPVSEFRHNRGAAAKAHNYMKH